MRNQFENPTARIIDPVRLIPVEPYENGDRELCQRVRARVLNALGKKIPAANTNNVVQIVKQSA